MNVSGSRIIRAAPADVWTFLLTPSRLRGCLPGCERFEQSSPTRFEGTMRLGIGFLKGTYHGTVEVAAQRPYEYLELAVGGGGALGSLQASGALTLRQAGDTTELSYTGDARVSGRIAALGDGVINATATKLIGLFFGCLSSHVESQRPAADQRPPA